MAPSGRDFAFVFYITLFFSIQISILGFKLNVKQIKDRSQIMKPKKTEVTDKLRG